MFQKKYFFLFKFLSLLIVLFLEKAVHSKELFVEGGYSDLSIGKMNLEGENASVRVYFFPGNFPENRKLLLGLGVRGEKAQGSESTSTYTNTSNYVSFQVGGDIGFKFKDPNWLSVYSIISLNYSPSTIYKNNLTINGNSITESSKVNSNLNLGINYKVLVNISESFSIGLGFYAAKGYLDFGKVTYNNTTISGFSGGYNITNINLIISYLFS
ncbi:hypothetical protein [Fluviispira sanaruensis]|uniref:Outer membrane protein beta-barrel domain-containing protein n=1 Tax=Fluviispira sanaruensis TaxID=2493639 RepID=A0A4P2VJU6_FLUSA|nr:hypothetical protein [Fluviispira sanaruensis]BBH52818.1 hypothetical protein JCM31447_12610 [Fluviispira sanaruensis]